jgi:site-specific recombinase XerD
MASSGRELARAATSELPEDLLVLGAGPRVEASLEQAVLDFFLAELRNRHTRRAYARAVTDLTVWAGPRGRTLTSLTASDIAAWLHDLGQGRSRPTVKQRLAGVRRFLDYLVVRGILPQNPALSVRGPAFSRTRGATPALAGDEVKRLLDSIESNTLKGLRDRALIALLLFTWARIDAALKLEVADYYREGKRSWVRLQEKRGSEHRLPVHHQAEEALDAYLTAAGISEGTIFQSFQGRRGHLTGRGLLQRDALAMLKRRALHAGLETIPVNHSLRATGITLYLLAGGDLEQAQRIANHRSISTTRLYDRREDAVTVAEIERVQL